MVFAIGPDDPKPAVEAFAEQMGLTFPVLYDGGGVVHDSYQQALKFNNTIYPQDWIIGVDGTVVYVSNTYDAGAMAAVIEAELAKVATDDSE